MHTALFRKLHLLPTVSVASHEADLSYLTIGLAIFCLFTPTPCPRYYTLHICANECPPVVGRFCSCLGGRMEPVLTACEKQGSLSFLCCLVNLDCFYFLVQFASLYPPRLSGGHVRLGSPALCVFCWPPCPLRSINYWEQLYYKEPLPHCDSLSCHLLWGLKQIISKS